MSAALSTTDAAALTLGTLTVQSARGENLRAEISLPQATAAELNSLAASIASPEVYRAQGMEYSPSASSIAVEVQRHADGTASLRLTSSAPINEPFIDLVLQTQWSAGQVARNYTLLLDAPKTERATPAAAVAPQVTTAPPSVMGRRYASKSAPKQRMAAAPPAASNPRAAVASDGSIRVRTGDTAGRIANANRPAGVSLDQMLVAMVRSNPKAFIDGNVNRLRAGAVLQVPSREQALETSASEARSIVAAQSRDFNAYRRSLATKAPKAAVQSAKRSASGKVQAQVAETRPTAEAPDKLTLSKGDAQTATTEAKVATQKQSADQDNRLSELQRNLAELNELANQAPAPTTATVPATATDNAVPPATAPEAPTDSAASTAGVEVANPTLAQSSPSTSETTPTPAAAQDTTVAEASAAAPSAPPAVAPATQAPASNTAQDPAPTNQSVPAGNDDSLSNPWVPVGAGLAAAVLGLLGFMAWKRRRNANDAANPLVNDQPAHLDEPILGHSQDAQDDAVTAAAADYASNLSVDADPLAEADMYLAYGRDTQAEEILKEALRKQPDQVACSVKLAEIYAKRQDLNALERIARDMQVAGQGSTPEWQRIVDMGRQLNPAHPYFASVGVPAAATAAIPAAVEQALPTSAFAAALDSAKAQGTATSPSTLAPSSAQPPSDAAQLNPSAAPAPFSEDFQDLGNLDLDLSAFDLPASPPPAAPAHKDDPFNLLPEPQLAPNPQAAPASPEVDLGSLDLDLDTGSASAAPAQKDDPFNLLSEPQLAPNPPAAPASPEIDLGSLDLDLDTGPASAAPAQPVHNLANDPLSTKLDLAQEFNSIGDSEGARSLIEEVLAEASGPLKERAQKMLSELD